MPLIFREILRNWKASPNPSRQPEFSWYTQSFTLDKEVIDVCNNLTYNQDLLKKQEERFMKELMWKSFSFWTPLDYGKRMFAPIKGV
jgi:hypothetical protein